MLFNAGSVSKLKRKTAVVGENHAELKRCFSDTLNIIKWDVCSDRKFY